MEVVAPPLWVLFRFISYVLVLMLGFGLRFSFLTKRFDWPS
jgi:hypothetical protein